MFVLKDKKSGKYYSSDKEFLETDKKYAKKLRQGQVKSLFFHYKLRGYDVVVENI